ncbi:MAG: glycosyltransferase [Nibricoccus sp.]
MTNASQSNTAKQEIFNPSEKLTLSLVASVGEINPEGPCGGLESAVIRTAKALARNGHKVAVIAKQLRREGTFEGVSFLKYEEWAVGRHPCFLQQTDVLAFTSGPDLGSYLLPPPQVARVALFHHQALNFQGGANPSQLLNTYTDRIICVSQAVRSNLTNAGIEPAKLRVVANGVNHEVFYPRDVARNPARILYVGALVPDKNPHTLINAFLMISPRLPETELHICGSAALWGEKDYFDQEEVRRRNPKIFFHGAISSEELAVQYSQAALCVIPSKFESFSLVSVEAQACGCVPLAAKTGGLPETMQPGVSGFLYEPNEAPVLASALAALLSDPSKLKEASRAAREFVRATFSWDKVAREYEVIFRDAMKSRRTRGADRLPAAAGVAQLSAQAAAPQRIRVSVVITCYNYRKYLRDCVRSVALQSFKEFEVIIVNDGSTDDSQAVAEKCLEEFSSVQITLISQPNSGQPALARNAGIRQATGEFILPLDADDQIGPDYLEHAFRAIDSKPSEIDIVCANALFVKDGVKTVARPGRFEVRTLSRANQLVYCCIYRRRLWEEIGGYRTNVRGYEDWDFWLAACLKGAKLAYVQGTGLVYNQKDQGVYSETVSHHQARIAQITLNNRGAYTAEQIAKAEETLGIAKAPVQQSRVTATSRRIIALMSAYNEGDIIYHAIGDLIANGLSVYLIDNHSTDNTVAEASRWLGKGLLKIERFPGDVSGYSERCSKEYVWREILRRKEELSGQLDAAWFLHVDADEFRESPWPGLTLGEAIWRVDQLGYNAINFDLYNFRPTDDAFVPGEDVRKHLTMYQPGELFDAVQIKAWKNPGVPAQLVNNGGHSIAIPQRRVFPLNFILRHYPIRGETHGRRKVYQDRLPRFAKEEVAINWHVQYNAFVDGREKFLHKPENLVVFDGERERARILGRFSDDVLICQTISGGSGLSHGLNQEAVFAWLSRRLNMTEPLEPEVGLQADQVLTNFLTALEKKQEVPVDEIDGSLANLLLSLLEMKAAHARLEGNSHFACVASRLETILRPRLSATASTAPEPIGEPSVESENGLPLVSLCIPTYNGAAFIAETIASALKQTYGRLEIIVSDDRSTDRTVELVEAAAKGSQIPVRILRHEPSGMVANWSNCIAHARGSYVKFLFQDDLLEPDCVERMVEIARKDSAIGLVFSPRRVELRGDKSNESLKAAYRESTDLHKGWTNLQEIQPGFALLNDSKLLSHPINKIGEPTTVLISKAALAAVGGFDPSLRQLVDVEMWLRIMTQFKVGFCHKSLSCFRLHPKQATQVNVQEGAIREDWKRFYGKLAEHSAFTSLPEEHRTAARAKFVQLGGIANEPQSQPVALGATNDFQAAWAEAEALLKQNRAAEAIVQLEKAAQLAPTPESLKHAQEILALLKAEAQKTSSEPAEPATPVAEGDFFGADEIQNIEQILVAYAANPADQAARTPVESLVQNLMQFLVTNKPEEIERLFRGNFAKVFRLLASSSFVEEPATEDSRGQLKVLDDALASSGDHFDFRPLLARMISAPAHRGSGAVVDFAKIPAWFLEDYLGYVLRAPQILAAKGEAEDYHEHLLRLAKAVTQRIQSRPNEPLTKTVASAFALKANCIPLYAGASSLRAFAEKRAAIIEFFLRKNGASLNATLPKRPKDRKKTKVGFLSAHFGAQTETHVTLPALQLDRNRFEVCVFAVANNPGPLEERCRSFADSFTVLPAKLDAQVAAIRSAALDVLVIGTNITAVTNQVLLIAAHRLAPLQLATYCSPSTTGLRQIDGYLSGTLNKASGVQEQFTEKLYFLEGAPGCLDYTVEAAATHAPMTRADLGLAADDLVFVNAASSYKILPEMLATWAEILKATLQSRLLLLPFNPNWTTNFPAKQFERILAETLEQHGVDRGRVVLVGPQKTRADVKAIEALADVYLDTAPFSGSISLVDALEVGLPTLVWEGDTHRSRAGSALIRSLGLTEMVVGNQADYVRRAVSLANDKVSRLAIRERTLNKMAEKPGFIHPAAYASHLGALLERLVSGKKPALATA